MYNFIVVLGSNYVSQQHFLLYVSLDNRMHVKDLPFQVLTVNLLIERLLCLHFFYSIKFTLENNIKLI